MSEAHQADRWVAQSGASRHLPRVRMRRAGHEVRTLARERFAPGTSAIERHLQRGEFERAAALDDRRVMGDQLVHQLVRCDDQVTLVTSEDPAGLGLEPRVRRAVLLDGSAARLAWECAG